MSQGGNFSKEFWGKMSQGGEGGRNPGFGRGGGETQKKSTVEKKNCHIKCFIVVCDKTDKNLFELIRSKVAPK